MNELKKEKEQLMKQVDIEEDHIANKLLKKLDEVFLHHAISRTASTRKNHSRTKTRIRTGVYGEPSSTPDPSHPPREEVHSRPLVHHSELHNRLKEDTQLLLRTIHSSIDLLQQARSASTTPALGYV